MFFISVFILIECFDNTASFPSFHLYTNYVVYNYEMGQLTGVATNLLCGQLIPT